MTQLAVTTKKRALYSMRSLLPKSVRYAPSSRLPPTPPRSTLLAFTQWYQDGEDKQLVYDWIIQTKNHTGQPKTPSLDLDYFLDFDISVLGAESSVYERYSADISCVLPILVYLGLLIYRNFKGRSIFT